MKHLYILTLMLLVMSPAANAGWFSKDPDPLDEAKARISQLETQTADQQRTLNQWQIASGCLGICCVVLFVFGTALGAQTRNHYGTLGRMGTTLAGPNGTKPSVVGKKPRQDLRSTLAT